MDEYILAISSPQALLCRIPPRPILLKYAKNGKSPLPDLPWNLSQEFLHYYFRPHAAWTVRVVDVIADIFDRCLSPDLFGHFIKHAIPRINYIKIHHEQPDDDFPRGYSIVNVGSEGRINVWIWHPNDDRNIESWNRKNTNIENYGFTRENNVSILNLKV